ncbi:alpha/beta hydrolase [Paracoccus marinaquae]|uniref:Alpha/beta fold hydrolase n=1 Tax=Paracoccus marinaquae TaxID=2841926 RepID=A0ABS6AJ15_9RHOB|nr:alpha/beta fold hydrolase [Paracoccus marinaquae]MBU3030543.1 alpha/beta fold hydrolase [Paracoccus marinaquae]
MFWLRAMAFVGFLLALALGLVLVFGPREPAELTTPRLELPEDLEAWIGAREAGIRPEVAARIEWAGEPGRQTDLALVYIHGFTGSPAELRPMPQQVAAELGANLYSVRLTGHGLDGAALADARLSDWWRDTAEAIAVAQRLGRRVVLVGLSTGATLAAEAALDPELGPRIDGVVLMSPNFAVNHRWAWVLDLPYARPLIRANMRRSRCFEPQNEAHVSGWTSCYAVESALPMAALLRHARGTDFGRARQPALFVWSDSDAVVRPRAIRRVADRWGGPVTRLTVEPGPRDDAGAHVIAGDALSPDLSVMLVGRVADWIAKTLPASPETDIPG